MTSGTVSGKVKPILLSVPAPRSLRPVQKLGMLIIDEEHSDSYKSDTAPRYHAREVAQKRSELSNCPVILGSATPSLESFHRAQHRSYQMLSLPDRVFDRKMPDVHLVDMRSELKKATAPSFQSYSEVLWRHVSFDKSRLSYF